MPYAPFIVGPLVGAVIGYFTNYLAVKMLFRPYREKRLFGKRIPFTPGVIPRRRGALARALGEAVGSRLLTKEDLCRSLLSEKTVDAVADAAADALLGKAGDPISCRLSSLFGEQTCLTAKERLDGAITDAMLRGLMEADLGGLVIREGAGALRGANPMIGMFLSDSLLERMKAPIGEKLGEYLSERGHADLLPSVSSETERLLGKDTPTLLSELGIDRPALRGLLGQCAERLLSGLVPMLLGSVDLAGIVESKINEMDVAELESLILSVMKRELGAVVNLGAVIGLILGVITAFF